MAVGSSQHQFLNTWAFPSGGGLLTTEEGGKREISKIEVSLLVILEVTCHHFCCIILSGAGQHEVQPHIRGDSEAILASA